MNETGRRQGRLVELSAEECWERVRSQPVGRIAWAGADGISVMPANFAVDGREILIRTSPYAALARECAEREVAFEVDHVDTDRQAGWSVLLRGRCRREERASDQPTPWASGRRTLGLRIEVRTVSGRAVLAH
jgi:uncharacterized protein